MARWFLLILMLAAVTAAAQPDSDLAREQRKIEAGGDLSSAANRVLFRARSMQDKQEFAGAAEAVEEWLGRSADREHHLLRFNLALSYFGLEEAGKALENLQLAVRDEPRFGRAWLRLGEAAYAQNQFATAAEAFQRGYELSPQHNPEILYYSGAAWLMADRPVQALDLMEELLEDDQATAALDWYQVLIASAVAADRPERAAPWVDRLLDNHAAAPEAWDLAYRYAAGRQDYRMAAVYLTVTGYLRDLSRSELIQLGDLLTVVEVPLQAARHYQQALELTTDESERREQMERLASSWLAAHEYGKALEAYRRVTEVSADEGRSWLMMGYCALELERPEEARRYLEKAAGYPDQAASANHLLNRL